MTSVKLRPGSGHGDVAKIEGDFGCRLDEVVVTELGKD